MISLSLDRHDFVSAVEGFAHGSHLRQHVWRDIVFRNIPQMTDDMDFFWYIFRRNLWDCYFRLRDGKMVCELVVDDAEPTGGVDCQCSCNRFIPRNKIVHKDKI